MPKWQEARIEEAMVKSPGVAPPGAARNVNAAGEGTTMILSFRPFPRAPFRQNWHALIPEFVWNEHFCDVQIAGPFAYWRHCHRVRAEVRDGVAGTVVTDDLTYAFRGGPLGGLANALGGRTAIAKIFAYRQEMTVKLMPMFVTRLKF